MKRTPTARDGIIAISILLFLAVGRDAGAQQRPLTTEDPETIGAGRVLVEGGLDYLRDQVYPASGLTGNLLAAPMLGFSVGISSIAELQIDGGLRNHLTITRRVNAPLSDLLVITGDTTSSVEDMVIGTKIRLLSENLSRPGVGIRFATRLPNASLESGVGRDTTDFFASLLIGKTVQSVRIVGNGGLGILSDPTRRESQNDVFVFGLSFARAVTHGAEVVGEIAGHAALRGNVSTSPPGTGNSAVMRLGARYTRSAARIDGAVILGMTGRDPSVGFTAGVTWVFNAFRIP
jgi:hypothetical protein